MQAVIYADRIKRCPTESSGSVGQRSTPSKGTLFRQSYISMTKRDHDSLGDH